MMNDPNLNVELNVVDIAAVGGVIATLAGWLPNIAAALSIVWLLIRIIESDTVKAIVARFRRKSMDRAEVKVQDEADRASGEATRKNED